MSFYYISYSKHPGDKANAVQVMHMCEGFAAHTHVTLVIPDLIPNASDSKICQHYGIPECFIIKRLPCFRPQWVYDTPVIKRFSSQAFQKSYYSFANSLKKYIAQHTQKDDAFYFRNIELLECFENRENVFFESHQYGEVKLEHLRQLKGVIAINQKLCDQVKSLGSANTTTEHDAVRVIPDYKAKPISEQITIGHIGRFTTMGQEKGIKELITAFSKAKLDKTKLVLIGASNLDEQKLYQEGTDKAIEVRMALNPHQVMQAYQEFDLVVLPLLNDQRNLSPLKLFEAMASGKGIIATKLDAHLELLNDNNALLCEPSIEDLSEKIKWAYSNLEQMQIRAKQAHADVQKHTWNKRAERILNFIQNSTSHD